MTIKELNDEATQIVTKSICRAYHEGIEQGVKEEKERSRLAKNDHYGLKQDAFISEIPVGRESLKLKFRSSVMTVEELCKNTKEQVAKQFNLTLRELLDLVDVLAHFNYVFCYDGFPF